MHMQTAAANPWIATLIVNEVLAEKGRFRGTFIRDIAGRQVPLRDRAAASAARASGALREDLDVRFAALSLLSLCMFPFLARHVAGPVLGLKFDEDEIERLSRTRRGCSLSARRRQRERRVRSTEHDCSSRSCPVAAASRSPRAATAPTTGRSSARSSATGSSWSRSRTSRSSRSRCVKAMPCRRARRCCGRSSARCRRASTRPIAARNVAERRLAELVKGPRAQEITEARAALEAARSSLETETQRVSSACRTSCRRKLVSQSALDQAACAPRQRRGNAQASGCASESAARRHARRGSRAGRSRAQAGAGRAGRSCRRARHATSSRRRAPGASKRFRTSWVSGPPPARR